MVSTSKAYESAGPLAAGPSDGGRTSNVASVAFRAERSNQPTSTISGVSPHSTSDNHLAGGQLEHHKLCYVPLPASDDPDFDTPDARGDVPPGSA